MSVEAAQQVQREALISHLVTAHDAVEDYGFPPTRQLLLHHQRAHGGKLYAGAEQVVPVSHHHVGLEAWNR